MSRYWTGPEPRVAGLVPGPGWAQRPVEVGEWRAAGEVTLHNRPMLVARLAAAGDPVLDTAGDVEVLARTWLRLGAVGLRAADGMFTLALAGPEETVLVRDHAGARTAYYAHTPAGWVAASSLRALRERAVPAGLGWRLDLPAVATFLTFAYLPGARRSSRASRSCCRARSPGCARAGRS
ncbi:hypothetical protein BJF78_27095 [Pseudonocardia sp. CNS-139]|nr:hypothetical protein BJF78_27095 [Pseudonocardia sp. CNS-139]